MGMRIGKDLLRCKRPEASLQFRQDATDLGSGNVEPVRVRVYGLYPLTKRRYLTQAVAGVVMAALIFVGWWFGWPPLRDRLAQRELPATMAFVVAVLNHVPWILLAALAFKAVEVYFVLRAFARKEGERGASAP